MKKTTLFFTIVILIVIVGFGCSCSRKGEIMPETDTSNIISLDLSNYEYYLTIHDVVTSSVSAAGGSVFAVTHEVTISGAVYGLYRNCALYYKVGDGYEREVKLNAAGYAQFTYTNSRRSYSNENNWGLTYVRCEGEIIQ